NACYFQLPCELPRNQHREVFRTNHFMGDHTSRCLATLLLAVSLITAGCTASANNRLFFGKTEPPRDNVMRYVSGSEPDSQDPANGQFLLAKDFEPAQAPPANAADPKAQPPKPRGSLSFEPGQTVAAEYPATQDEKPDADTAFHQFMHSPDRLVLAADEKKRA